ncbi:MAG TPA: hypothetical protein VF132_10415 [Rudaea sp.]
MQTAEDTASTAPPPEPNGGAAGDAQSGQDARPGQIDAIVALAHEGTEFLRNFLQLLLGETALAKMSLQRLVIAALIVPSVILTAWLALNALLAVLLERWLQSWIGATVIVLAFDGAIVAVFAIKMLRWWRDLSLPRTRAAIARLLERPR